MNNYQQEKYTCSSHNKVYFGLRLDLCIFFILRREFAHASIFNLSSQPERGKKRLEETIIKIQN